MRIVNLCLHLLPTLSVLALAWFVIRSVSVRITWRDADVRSLDDEPA